MKEPKGEETFRCASDFGQHVLTRLLCTVFVLLLLGAHHVHGQTLPAGDHHWFSLTTPSEYFQQTGPFPRSVWTRSIIHTGATYIALHFESLNLGPLDYLEMSDKTGEQRSILRGTGRLNGTNFWGQRITGDTIVLKLVVGGRERGRGFAIDRYSAGFPKRESGVVAESLCWYDDKQNAACLRGTIQYLHGKAVARILVHTFYGDITGTGFLVSRENHLLTAQHVITSADEAANAEFEFMAEAPQCGSYNCDGCWPGQLFFGADFIQSSYDLDYTLVQIGYGAPASIYGFLEVESRLPNIGEQIYVPQHPSGMAKEFAIYSDVSYDSGGVCRIQSLNEYSCQGLAQNAGYYADTEGGSSGAPVISAWTQKVVALHHCGGCLNTGVPTLPIWNEIRCFLEPKSLSSTNFSGSASGATNEVSIADPNACGWTVQSACDWVTISDNAGAGDFVVKISAGFNSSGLTRSCSLIIAGQNYVFNQAPCLYSLSPSAVTLPASGSNQTVTVTTADACGWIATSTNSWIEIGNTSTSIGSGQFSFSVLPNASLKTRTGTIRLAGQVLTVTQAADTEKPFAVAITEPATGQIYHFPQAVNISSSASDNIGVSRVEFYDGAIRRGVANTPPFTFAWQVGQTNNGAHLWTAKAYDAAGNLTVSPVVNLTVKVTPPLTSINFPTPLQRWSNQVITVQGKATDDLQVSGVYCKVNEGDWTLASSGNNWSNWTASATLNPGTNLISTYAEDATGNLSSTTKVSCIYVLSAQLALNVTGKGTLSPNYNGQSLEIGRGYTLTATPGAGFAFTNWTGNQTTNKPTLSFLMASNLEFTANFVDLQRPTLSITAPLANQRWSNELISVTGKVTDNYFVDSVYWKLNTGDWTPATTGNSWSNWTAAATLAPGTNVFRAYAQDSAGNLSSTSSVSFVYVLSAPVTVNVSGKGTLNPNYSGQRLELGRGYTITATPGPGFVFTNWTGSRATNKPALWFLMASNLEFSANFIDVQRPTLSIAAPTANQRWSNEIFTVQGKSGDNSSVEDVYWQLNGGDWTLASSANGWSNWMSAATLVPGTNFIRAYAQDGSGNRSATSSVSVVYVLAAPLSVNLSGKGSVTPNYNANALEIGRGYTMTATAGAGFVFTNWTGSHTTNKSTLWFLMASNLEFTANFLDIQRPTLSITAPLANQRLSNSTFIAQGKAIDNYQVTAVFQKLNESEWSLASSTNGWTNWVAELALTQSTNVFMAYAADAGGNLSTTNVITFLATNLVAAQLRLGLQSATLTESGEMELRFNISPSEAGRIEVSTNLIDWQFFSDFIGTNAFVRFTDPAARTHQLRFFRAVAPQR